MIQRWLSVICVLFLAGGSNLSAQDLAPELRIIVLQGAGVTHLVNRNRHEIPVVVVQTQNNQPLAGARVTFQLPESGPGGTFGKNRMTLTVTTNRDGRAEGKGFRPNKELGEFNLRVTATHGAWRAETQLRQVNALSPTAEASRRSGRNMVAVYVVIVGASALVGAIMAAKSLN